MKTIEWGKCVICQTIIEADLRKAGDEGIAKFASAAKYRNDATYQRLQNFLETLHTMDNVWHCACYQSYTSSHDHNTCRESRLWLAAAEKNM